MTDIPHRKEKQFYYADPEHRRWRWRNSHEDWTGWVTSKEPEWVCKGEYQVEEYRPKFASGALSEAPEEGEDVWVFDMNAGAVYPYEWGRDMLHRLHAGLVFPDEQSAQRALDAVLDLLGRKE